MKTRVATYQKVLERYFAEKGHADPVTITRYFSAVLDGVQMHLMFDPDNFPMAQVKQMIIDQFVPR
ncbi:MAG: hypothetical protein WD077_02090 [Bacteroidia bacterium]